MVSSARYSDVTALHTEGGEVADVQSEVAEGLFLESGYILVLVVTYTIE